MTLGLLRFFWHCAIALGRLFWRLMIWMTVAAPFYMIAVAVKIAIAWPWRAAAWGVGKLNQCVSKKG